MSVRKHQVGRNLTKEFLPQFSLFPKYLHANFSIKHHSKGARFFFFFFFSVLRPFQDYFSSYETGQSVGGRKQENPEKNHLAHPQAELGLSHMWPERGSNSHQTQR